MLNTRFLVLFVYALLALQNVKAQDAETLYNEGLQLKKEKKIDEAFEKFKEAVSLKPDYTAALYECGWCQNDLKKYSSAVDYLRKARVGGWESVPKLHFELGYAFHRQDMFDSAVKSYKRCLELKPDYSGALRQLGYIAYFKDDYTLAIDYFKKYEGAAKEEITDYQYWYRKGFCFNALKDYASAKINLLKSLSFKENYTSTYLELGFACTKLKTQDEEAIAYFKKAIELEPQNHVSYNGIGEVYRDNKRNMDEAILWYNKTLTVEPRERKAQYGIGYCLNSKGQYEEAIKYLKIAIEEEPGYTAAYVELGYSYYKTGKYNDALINLNKAISLNPKNENARYYATLIYVSQKNKTMAQKMVNELKELSSKHVAALQPKVDAL